MRENRRRAVAIIDLDAEARENDVARARCDVDGAPPRVDGDAEVAQDTEPHERRTVVEERQVGAPVVADGRHAREAERAEVKAVDLGLVVGRVVLAQMHLGAAPVRVTYVHRGASDDDVERRPGVEDDGHRPELVDRATDDDGPVRRAPAGQVGEGCVRGKAVARPDAERARRAVDVDHVA